MIGKLLLSSIRTAAKDRRVNHGQRLLSVIVEEPDCEDGKRLELKQKKITTLCVALAIGKKKIM